MKTISGGDSKDRRRFLIIPIMESPETPPGNHPNRPPPRPPPLPPLPYVSVRNIEWQVAATFSNAAQWHAANKILSRHGIIGQMRISTSDNPEIDLLVLQTELEWARDLLSHVEKPPPDISNRGFPLDEVTPQPREPAPVTEMAAIPIEPRPLTETQSVIYTLVRLVFWIILVVTLFAIFIFVMNY